MKEEDKIPLSLDEVRLSGLIDSQLPPQHSVTLFLLIQWMQSLKKSVTQPVNNESSVIAIFIGKQLSQAAVTTLLDEDCIGNGNLKSNDASFPKGSCLMASRVYASYGGSALYFLIHNRAV